MRFWGVGAAAPRALKDNRVQWRQPLHRQRLPPKVVHLHQEPGCHNRRFCLNWSPRRLTHHAMNA
jgi:hypothetical protein